MDLHVTLSMPPDLLPKLACPWAKLGWSRGQLEAHHHAKQLIYVFYILDRKSLLLAHQEVDVCVR